MRLEYIEDARVVLLSRFDARAVRDLREALLTLTHGRSREVRIDRLPGVEPVGAISLLAISAPIDQGVEGVGPLSLRCGLTPEGWRNVIGLLEPFEEHGEGDFFQYLSEEGEAAWIISASGQW